MSLVEPSSPRISVIVRCHQQGRFLEEAVASALAQTRTPDEIVVVDDGSTDTTQQVLRSLEARASILSVHHDVARGPAASFNAGVAASSGDLILALDADDVLSSRYVELTEKAIHVGADLAYGGVERFGTETSTSPAPPFDADELGVENFLHVSTLFRRSFFETTGGFRSDFDRLGLEDWEFWLGVVEQGARGVAVEGCWLGYRRHPGGSRNSMRHFTVLRAHLRVHRLHPKVVTWRHLGRWVSRSLQRNVPALGRGAR